MKTLLFLLALVLSTSCGSEDGPVPLDSDFECAPRTDDVTGYLQPICQYLVANRDSYEIDPNALEILSLVSGEEWSDSDSLFANAEHDFVRLSCCFTGDVAVLHKATGTVVDFLLGDV